MRRFLCAVAAFGLLIIITPGCGGPFAAAGCKKATISGADVWHCPGVKRFTWTNTDHPDPSKACPSGRITFSLDGVTPLVVDADVVDDGKPCKKADR